MVLALGTSHAQQDNYVFANARLVGATNLMASDCISYPLGCKVFGLAGGMEWIGFINESFALRVRGDLIYSPSSAGEFNAAMIQLGAGILVSNRDGKPYGFFELKPRFNRSATTLAYSHEGTRAFVTLMVGIGWDVPIYEQLWLALEGGISQSITYYNSYVGQDRNEVGAFLTVGVRYLINYGCN